MIIDSDTWNITQSSFVPVSTNINYKETNKT